MMEIYNDSLATRFREMLLRRAQQLRASLQEPDETATPDGHEVGDFKDLASHESEAAVHDAQEEHTSRELQQVLAALARLDSHNYGLCLECSAPINLQRLEALPETPLCMACQSRREAAQTH